MRILSIAVGKWSNMGNYACCTVQSSVYNSTKDRDIACSLYCGCHLEPRSNVIFNTPTTVLLQYILAAECNCPDV